MKALVAVLLLLFAVQAPAVRPVVVASKPFGESYLLAEMFAQVLEAKGFTVERRLGLGATEIAFQALRTGAIDVYPEYTGTGLLAILGEEPASDPRSVFAYVASEFRRRYDARWLPLSTLSDLAREGSDFIAGFTPDFIGRPDGLPGLTRAYGFTPADVRSLLPAIKYQALAAGEVDVIDGYSTDGLIARYDLRVLEDDRDFFPPYEAAALVNGSFAASYPEAVLALTELSGRLSESRMRELNQRIEVDGEPIPYVARDAVQNVGLLARDGPAASGGGAQRSGLARYLWNQRTTLASLTLRHVYLVGVSLLAAVLLAVPLGLLLERRRRSAESVIRGAGLFQTLPGIALLAFMIPLLGIGVLPALVALFLYSIFPILRNTFTGVREADPAAVEAGTALGMTPHQVLLHVRLPLAAPVVMAGIRTAAVINVGTATLAAFIGAGGLGDPIVAGLALSDTRMILSGALPAALLALVVDGTLALGERWVTPGR
jgi:osmoprotectant transport system permease protein